MISDRELVPGFIPEVCLAPAGFASQCIHRYMHIAATIEIA